MNLVRRAARFVLASLLLLSGGACSSPESSSESAGPPPPALLVELAGSRGRDGYRVLHPEDRIARTVKDREAVAVVDDFRMACRTASLQAFDALRRASAGALPTNDRMRVELRVVPSPDQRWAILTGTSSRNLQLVDLGSGRIVPWPEAIAPRVKWALAWSPDSRCVALLVGEPDGRDEEAHVAVLDVAELTVLLELPDRAVDAGWSPDGSTLALLTRINHADNTPIGLLGDANGPPDVLSDFHLELCDVRTRERWSVRIERQSAHERGTVVWDRGATASVIAEAYERRIPPGELPAKP